ncbi:MAG: glycosyltransferase family 2 protein [Gammaproteobacteria bacterium]|nr:glycosyltransferase family 2 protein [Gammaproteobacteria bacterium]
MTSAYPTPEVELEKVCVVIPVYRDAQLLEKLLNDLKSGSFRQVVISYADTPPIDFEELGDFTYVHSSRGRGLQIAEAISSTDAEWIWILHADVRVSRNALLALRDTLAVAKWGAFKVNLTGRSVLLNTIASMMNWRSRVTSIYTGDQGMFICRDLLGHIGGFPAIHLMEDVECSRLLRRLQRGTQVPVTLTVSSRKWEREGVVRTILKMWICRVLYFFGASPENLADRYYS